MMQKAVGKIIIPKFMWLSSRQMENLQLPKMAYLQNETRMEPIIHVAAA